MMRNKSGSPREPNVFFHEYVGDGWKPTCSTASWQEVNLFVVLDGETRRLFSSLKVVVYYNGLPRWYDRDGWVIQKSTPVTCESSADHGPHTPRNDPTFPSLTVTLKLYSHYNRGYDLTVASPREAESLRRRNNKSVRIVLESEHLITPDTTSISLPFTISSGPNVCCLYNPSWNGVIVHTVQVISVDRSRPRKTIHCLPAEILLQTFDAVCSYPWMVDWCYLYGWQHNLLSCAQVCRQWAKLSLKALFARVGSSSSEGWEYLDTCAFAKAVSETPALGHDVQHLHYDYGSCWRCGGCGSQTSRLGLIKTLNAILRATTNLQHLCISLQYSSKATAPLSATPSLHRLRMLSITRPAGASNLIDLDSDWEYSINSIQLAHCLARWSALTSLTVEHLKPGGIGMWRRFFLQPPTCALTKFCIRKSTLSDRDLLYFTASSASTLAQVTLDHVRGITNRGLHTFLDSISQNVTSLTIRDGGVLESSLRLRDKESGSELALDAMVDKMPRLHALHIGGGVASQQMLRRRSEMFLRNSGVPVVRLVAGSVPGILECKGQEWAGWELGNIY